MYLKLLQVSESTTNFEVYSDQNLMLGKLSMHVDRSVTANAYGFDESVCVSNIELAMNWIEESVRKVKLEEVRKLVLEGRKIPAIGVYRKYVDPNANIAVARDAVEKIFYESSYDVHVYEGNRQAWSFFYPNTVPLKKGDVFERFGQTFKVTASDEITLFVEEVA